MKKVIRRTVKKERGDYFSKAVPSSWISEKLLSPVSARFEQAPEFAFDLSLGRPQFTSLFASIFALEDRHWPRS